MRTFIASLTVLFLIIGCVTTDIDVHPVLLESEVDSVQWMGGFIVTPAEASTQ